MTNYINEMMETAGVNKQWVTYSREDIEGCIQLSQKGNYPDFTAEKQLEIIKVIAGNKDFYINKIGSEWELSALTETNLEGLLEEHNKDFPQALAQLTTELMNAGEVDKKKVKEILEGWQQTTKK